MSQLLTLLAPCQLLVAESAQDAVAAAYAKAAAASHAPIVAHDDGRKYATISIVAASISL